MIFSVVIYNRILSARFSEVRICDMLSNFLSQSGEKMEEWVWDTCIKSFDFVTKLFVDEYVLKA